MKELSDYTIEELEAVLAAKKRIAADVELINKIGKVNAPPRKVIPKPTTALKPGRVTSSKAIEKLVKASLAKPVFYASGEVNVLRTLLKHTTFDNRLGYHAIKQALQDAGFKVRSRGWEHLQEN